MHMVSKSKRKYCLQICPLPCLIIVSHGNMPVFILSSVLFQPHNAVSIALDIVLTNLSFLILFTPFNRGYIWIYDLSPKYLFGEKKSFNCVYMCMVCVCRGGGVCASECSVCWPQKRAIDSPGARVAEGCFVLWDWLSHWDLGLSG